MHANLSPAHPRRVEVKRNPRVLRGAREKPMAKVSGSWLAVVMVATVVMQGCAQTGAVRSGASPAGSAGVAPSASAAATSTAADDREVVFTVDTRERFSAFAKQIRLELRPNGQYARLDEAERRTLGTGVAEIEALFDQYQTVYRMPAPDRAKALAEWDAINGILARDPRNLLICGEVTPLGSHLRKTICRTLSQLGYRKGQNPRLRVALMGIHNRRS